MSRIQINDVKLDGVELFNDSETYLNELQDSETVNVVGGGRIKQPFDKYITKPYITTVYIPKEPIHPVGPTHPIEPTHPKKPIHPKLKELPFEPVIL